MDSIIIKENYKEYLKEKKKYLELIDKVDKLLQKTKLEAKNIEKKLVKLKENNANNIIALNDRKVQVESENEIIEEIISSLSHLFSDYFFHEGGIISEAKDTERENIINTLLREIDINLLFDNYKYIYDEKKKEDFLKFYDNYKEKRCVFTIYGWKSFESNNRNLLFN